MSDTHDGLLAAWQPAGASLLRALRLETARSGHTTASAAHLLLAVLDQAEVFQALRAIGLRPDIYALRRRVAADALAPTPPDEEIAISEHVRALLAAVRPRADGEEPAFLHLLVLKQAVAEPACRRLLEDGRIDLARLDQALARIR